jgi:hypothetical protein
MGKFDWTDSMSMVSRPLQSLSLVLESDTLFLTEEQYIS